MILQFVQPMYVLSRLDTTLGNEYALFTLFKYVDKEAKDDGTEVSASP